MTTSSAVLRSRSNPVWKLAFLGTGFITIIVLSRVLTGEYLPSDPYQALLVQNSLLLVVLGSTIVEQHFTRPSEGLVNAISAGLTIFVARGHVHPGLWWVLTVFIASIGVLALFTMVRQRPSGARLEPSALDEFAFQYVSRLGRARVVFSVVFLAAVAFTISNPEPLTMWLLIFWALYVVAWPNGLGALAESLFRSRVRGLRKVATVERVDSPRLIRVSVVEGARTEWDKGNPLIAHLPGGESSWVVPLISQSVPDGVWGVGLLADTVDVKHKGFESSVTTAEPDDDPPSVDDLLQAANGVPGAELLGVVVEGSSSNELVFEVLPDSVVVPGTVVLIQHNGMLLYFQVTLAETTEETFGKLHFGSVRAVATQIGTHSVDVGWVRQVWTPMMNLPVFSALKQDESAPASSDELLLGAVPGTGKSLTGDFGKNLTSHTAVLGATGTGKTEFAFSLLRDAVSQGVKVVCIDLTGQYAQRLQDLAPVDLSVSRTQADDLGKKLFAVETGAFGAKDERRILQDFTSGLKSEVLQVTRDYLESAGGGLALIELREISNTKATLAITELFLSAILELARTGVTGQRQTLVVVEEAHTVMPEPSFVGLGDFETRGTVAKISQIALQGRKYGVGLLVIAQRTATVSKSVLTQCNTVVSFACHDDTSIGFLSNVYGAQVASALPDLPRLNAVAHGEWIRSDAPVVFEVPFDSEKAALTMQPVGLITSRGTPASVSHAPASAQASKAAREVEEPPF